MECANCKRLEAEVERLKAEVEHWKTEDANSVSLIQHLSAEIEVLMRR
jgi:hypothetical protein